MKKKKRLKRLLDKTERSLIAFEKLLSEYKTVKPNRKNTVRDRIIKDSEEWIRKGWDELKRLRGKEENIQFFPGFRHEIDVCSFSIGEEIHIKGETGKLVKVTILHFETDARNHLYAITDLGPIDIDDLIRI